MLIKSFKGAIKSYCRIFCARVNYDRVLEASFPVLFWVLLRFCRLQGLMLLCSRILCIPRSTIVEEAQKPRIFLLSRMSDNIWSCSRLACVPWSSLLTFWNSASLSVDCQIHQTCTLQLLSRIMDNVVQTSVLYQKCIWCLGKSIQACSCAFDSKPISIPFLFIFLREHEIEVKYRRTFHQPKVGSIMLRQLDSFLLAFSHIRVRKVDYN